MAADADAETDDERLAKKFSPILILTEDTLSGWGEDTNRGIIVLKPEPVNIMGATSADRIMVHITDLGTGNLQASGRFGTLIESGVLDTSEVRSHQQEWNSDFLGNKWAFLTKSELKYLVSETSKGKLAQGLYFLNIFLDYPGKTPKEWNDTYLGSGPYAGANFPNTAYVHIYPTILSSYDFDLTVIQYHYFYPYNDWWNNHEGDWQRVDVVIDSEKEKVIGIEYRFHGAHLSYYKDYTSPQGPNPFSSAKLLGHTDICCVPSAGLTDSFVFNPQDSLKLSQGTHPVVYVGSGSHAAYPIGGNIKIYPVTGDREYMTHTGKVLSTQADDSDTTLWEPYNLVVLPKDLPDTSNTNNMGLLDTLSWLGARIRWGTPAVSGPIISETEGNESPKKGPYNSETDGWGNLKVFKKGHTGPSGAPSYFEHSDLPYEAYHHWAIIGDETWSGTVSLYGDVVVFPSSKLTIKAGTVVTFPSGHDRHQFSAPGNRYYYSEIFVYGSLESEGTSSNPVVLGGTDPANTAERWDGLRELGSGSVDLGNHTTIRNAKPVKPVFVRTMLSPDSASVSVDWEPANDPSISGYQTRISTDGTTWPEWSEFRVSSVS